MPTRFQYCIWIPKVSTMLKHLFVAHYSNGNSALGIILVVLLFILNLTVTIGTINMFILYVNITSIFSTMLFQQEQHNFVTTFISLANFDLGIKTCFYDGMDDYAKVWLELAFPFYLLCIATLLIISSRYSTKVQRFTARKTLPVLATLFLSSYTKILLAVLFSYSTITHLPSGHSTLVGQWMQMFCCSALDILYCLQLALLCLLYKFRLL